ncbi:SETMR methyltransferase, partial [Acromyrmex charruanus]
MHGLIQQKKHKPYWKNSNGDHPPYSPDLAPSDFYLFPKLKESLGGHHFNSNDEVKDFVKLFFKKQGTDFYKLGLSKLQNRYKKCIQVQGDYVEK